MVDDEGDRKMIYEVGFYVLLGIMYGYVLCLIISSLRQTKKDYIYSILILLFSPLFIVYMIIILFIDEIKIRLEYRKRARL